MIVKPQKAVTANLSHIHYPILASPKIDGVRGIFLEKFTSRTLKRFANNSLHRKFNNPIYRGLDGELAFGEITDPNLCRQTTSTVNSISKENEVIWHVFDLLTEVTRDLPYQERHRLLEKHYSELPNVSVLPYTTLKTESQLKKQYDRWIEAGYEGIILRNPVGTHKSGRSTTRENGYLRLKPQGSEELTITSVIEAQTNLNEAIKNELGETARSSHQSGKEGNGMIGALIGLTDKGERVKIGAGKLTHEERIRFFRDQDKIIGQRVTFGYLNHGKHKAYRHPRFLTFRNANH